ncbi:MAG TPA: glycoside hydrolase family 3 N-terminal domain-containing protein [Thermoleophilaceae bacterium]|nr:glycoside hydrolase family 3 N-terminal domain-containing protein [Thermoleophilaceae bacterium]
MALTVAATIVLAVACGGDDDGGGAGLTTQSAGSPTLPLRQAVGQLLVMAFDGTSAPGYVRRRLRDGEGAGVILFGGNVVDATQLRRLTRSIQGAARSGALIATDQEGGEIRNVPFAGPAAPQSATATPAEARAAATEAARGLRSAGVNVNLAPVADVEPPIGGGALPGRLYPGDPRQVAALTTAAIQAHERAGVAATVKHYPGLGRATVNTDDGSATIDAPRAELEAADLEPYRAAVAADAPLVMAGHALYPAFDPDRIASQSRTLLTDVLRDQLGFRGVAITDSIEAQAVLDRSDVATAAVRSIAAGADIVLMTGSGSWNLVYPRLLRAARRSPAFRSRVRESAERVLALKRRLGLRAGP